MLAHDVGNGSSADAVTDIAEYDNVGTAALTENSLKNRKILLILPEIGSLGGVL